MTNRDLPALPEWMYSYKIPCDAFDGGDDVRLSDRMRAYGELCRAAPAGGDEPVGWVDPYELMMLREHGGMLAVTAHAETESKRTTPLYLRTKNFATDGGEPCCPQCKAPMLFECVACSHSNYPKDSAPAEQFCDGNCVWTDHHPECQIGNVSAPAGSGEDLIEEAAKAMAPDLVGWNGLLESEQNHYRGLARKASVALLRKLQQGADSADAARYRKLKPMMLSADFEPEDYVGLTFALPAGTCVMANLDSILDGIASQGQEGGSHE